MYVSAVCESGEPSPKKEQNCTPVKKLVSVFHANALQRGNLRMFFFFIFSCVLLIEVKRKKKKKKKRTTERELCYSHLLLLLLASL